MKLDPKERDPDGNLTPTALAADAIGDHGCDCGTDEPGTCIACRCERALIYERAAQAETRAHLAALTEALKAHVDLYGGADHNIEDCDRDECDECRVNHAVDSALTVHGFDFAAHDREVAARALERVTDAAGLLFRHFPDDLDATFSDNLQVPVLLGELRALEHTLDSAPKPEAPGDAKETT